MAATRDRKRTNSQSGSKSEMASTSLSSRTVQEEDFPRGGASALTPLEVRKIKHEAEEDVLFGVKKASPEVESRTRREKKTRKKKTTTKELESKAEISGKFKLKHVESLTFKKLYVGMKVLGAIKEVNEYDMVISLPNGLSGFVHITHINEKITEKLKEGLEAGETKDSETNLPELGTFFTTGCLVQCSVLELEGSKPGQKKIKLSLEPKEVNSSLSKSSLKQGMVLPGYVSSVEDHGYLISFGIEDTKAFLPKKDVIEELNEGHPLCLLVKSAAEDKRIITVTADRDEIQGALVKEDMKLKFSTLLPGMLVKASVTQATHGGLLQNFLGGFEGSVDILHLPNCGGNGQNLEEAYPGKTKVKCRLLYINANTKTVGLSLQENVVLNKATSFGNWSIGDIEDAVVMRVDQGMGLLMRLSDNSLGFAHISRVSDERVEKLGKKYKAGTTHRCRILGFNSLDGLITLTMEKSVIEQPFLRYHDVKPGSQIKGKIITLEKFGMLVSVSDHIRGLCSTLHLADINLKHPEKKLKEGKVVKCRVLSVEPDRRRLLLTHKKTMVESDLPLITDYSDAKPGVSTHGFVTAIKDFGCLVTFYNNVKGLVPRTELGISPDTDPRSAFYIGQVMICYVLSCQPDQAKLRLSFKSSFKSTAVPLETDKVAGLLLEGDVVNNSADGLDILLQPSGAPAFLPVSHLSDHLINCKALLSVYAPSTKLKNVVYYGRSKDKSMLVSLKPSLVKAATERSLLRSFGDLKVGMILPGVVKKLMTYGVFIEFSTGIFGLAPNSFLADQFVSEPASHFKIGQTVMAKVTEIDAERQRFLVSLKPSECFPERYSGGYDVVSGVELLENFLSERQKIALQLAASSEEMKVLTSLTPGSCVEAKVVHVKFQGIVLQLADRVQGFVPHQLAKGVSCDPGEVVFGCVLDWDFDKKVVFISLNQQLVAQRKTVNSQKVKQKKLKSGQEVEACVQLIKDNFIVVILPQHGYRLAYSPTKLHLNDISDASKRFAVGQTYSAFVQRQGSMKDNLLPLVTLREKHVEKENIIPGAITTVQVKSVKDFQMNVNLCGGKFHGRVHVTHVCDEVTEGESPFKAFHNGDKVQVKIMGFRDTKTHKFLPISHQNFTKAVAELTMKPSELSPGSAGKEDTESTEDCELDKKLDQYKVGEELNCFVKMATDHCVWMMASPSVNGRVTLLHASSDVEVLKSLKTRFKPGDGYRCMVLNVDKERNFLDLSIAVKADSAFNPGKVIVGQISKVLPDQALYVRLPLQKSGMVALTDLRDSYVDNPLQGFDVNQIFRCFVLSSNEKGQLDLSLRPSRTEGLSTMNEEVAGGEKMDREIKGLDDLKEGDIIRGYVKSCSDVGVFVSLSHHIVARVQIKNLSQYYVKKWKPLFHPGKLVTGKVVSVNPTKGHVELSLKGTDVGGTDPAPKPKRMEEKEKNRKERKGKGEKRKKHNEAKEDSEDEAEDILKKLKTDSDDEDSAVTDNDEQDEEAESSSDEEADKEGVHKINGLARLQLSSGFDWSGEGAEEGQQNNKRMHESDDESSDSETETSEQVARKKSKRQKRAAKKAEEDFLYKTEQSLLDQNRLPETADDFDRLVVSSPNNSVVWLQYMAYHLHTTDFDKARAVAERALKTISFREEQEKLNVWVALMNLENLYGAQESLVKVFERALQQSEPKKVFFQLIGIYTRTDKFELAEQLYQTMSKRFSQSKKVWVNFGAFYMKQGKLESGRKLLQRSLKSLPKRKHIATIVQFALHEFRYGEPQRGQTMLESILTNYPKRSDLWSVYLDMMIKQGNAEPVRQIFERVIHINLSSKKMKLFFKRYLDFERKYGDAFSVENVKTKAMEYVESKAGLN